MTTIDPTSLPPSAPINYRNIDYSVEDIALMQYNSIKDTRAGKKNSNGSPLKTKPPVQNHVLVNNEVADNFNYASGSTQKEISSFPKAETPHRREVWADLNRTGNPFIASNMDRLNLRSVSGRYRGRAGGGELELELRIDVDGCRPTRKVSGDFYRTVGDTVTYVGSFIVNGPTISLDENKVVIEGQGNFTFTIGAPRLVVTIARVGEFTAPPAADAQFMTGEGVPGTKYNCDFQSSFFRQVEFETDFVKAVTPFSSYDVSLLPSGGPTRTLTVTGAFAEAGIEMIDTGGSNEVPIDLAGGDLVWSNRELHASMESHFLRWKNEPQLYLQKA